jgi:hypothetical protein
MNSIDDEATVNDRIPNLWVHNFPQQHYPMCSFEASNEHFNATAIMVLDDDGHNNG